MTKELVIINSKLKLLALGLKQHKNDELVAWISDCIEDMLKDIDCIQK